MTKDLLIEIGSEELPSKLLKAVVPQFESSLVGALDAAHLSHGAAKVFSTPRRIALYVHDVAQKTPAVHTKRRGPKVEAAFDANGNPTQAALGFARGAGVEVDALERTEEDGAIYVCATIDKPETEAISLLPELIENTLAGLKWPKSQRWGDSSVFYGRPVRWIVALFGSEVVPVHFGDVSSSNVSRAHRVLGHPKRSVHGDVALDTNGRDQKHSKGTSQESFKSTAKKRMQAGEQDIAEFAIERPEVYKEALRDHGVLLREERAVSIKEQIAALEKAQGVRVDMPQQTFEEVVDLCEYPLALVGHFDEDFLQIPHEIICESMLSHQRYFPIYKPAVKDKKAKRPGSFEEPAAAAGELAGEPSVFVSTSSALPSVSVSASSASAPEYETLTTGFVVIANGDEAYAKDIIAGNERVVRARLNDAQFFYKTDVKIPLEDRLPQLKEVVFQSKLGTLLDKTRRLEALAPLIVREDNGTQEEVALAKRAAQLSKCDLVSQTVIEFTSQQGVMGGYFAAAQGENSEVSTALSTQYCPRFATDVLPPTKVARALAVADKLDTLVGMFAIGEPPTGSSDPFALRRGAIGIIRILQEEDAISLPNLIDAALDQCANQGISFDRSVVCAQVKDFFATRLATMAKEQGISAQVIKAIQNTDVIDPATFFERITILGRAKEKDPQLYGDLATAFSRAHNLITKGNGALDAATADKVSVNEKLLSEEEKSFYQACKKAEKALAQQLAAHDFEQALNTLAALRGPIDLFFENVMVMDEDPSIRANRLAQLNNFLVLFSDVADISALA